MRQIVSWQDPLLVSTCLHWLYPYSEHDLRWWTDRLGCSTSPSRSSLCDSWDNPFSISDLLKPNHYSTHFSPTPLTSLKSVSATIWNVPLHLNYVFTAFPQSLWFVFFPFSHIHVFPTQSLGVCRWYYTRNAWIKDLFPRNHRLQKFSSRSRACSFCLATALYIVCTINGHNQCSLCSIALSFWCFYD